MWNAALGDSWDVNFVPNSPAIDAGTVSGATRDISGVSRPKGSAFDIGAYDTCVSGCTPPPSHAGSSSGRQIEDRASKHLGLDETSRLETERSIVTDSRSL